MEGFSMGERGSTALEMLCGKAPILANFVTEKCQSKSLHVSVVF